MTEIVQPIGSFNGVESLNGLTGDVTLVAGSNISITPSGQNITIASTGSGGITDITSPDGTITIAGATGPTSCLEVNQSAQYDFLNPNSLITASNYSGMANTANTSCSAFYATTAGYATGSAYSGCSGCSSFSGYSTYSGCATCAGMAGYSTGSVYANSTGINQLNQFFAPTGVGDIGYLGNPVGNIYGSSYFSCLGNAGITQPFHAGTFQNGLLVAPTSGITDSYSEIASGSGTTFTLANTPIPGTVRVYGEGQRLTPGTGKDYTISVSTITTVNSWATGSILVDYSH